MAGLHVHLRAVILTAVVASAVLIGGSCSCSDRVVGDASESHGEPACLWLIAPRAYHPDGTSNAIRDPMARRVGTACLCLTQEEYDSLGDRLDRVHFPEPGTILDEFNELGYDECKRLAALIDDVDDDECLDYYEHGTWLKDIYFARGGWDNGTPPGFTCVEP